MNCNLGHFSLLAFVVIHNKSGRLVNEFGSKGGHQHLGCTTSSASALCHGRKQAVWICNAIPSGKIENLLDEHEVSLALAVSFKHFVHRLYALKDSCADARCSEMIGLVSGISSNRMPLSLILMPSSPKYPPKYRSLCSSCQYTHDLGEEGVGEGEVDLEAPALIRSDPVP